MQIVINIITTCLAGLVSLGYFLWLYFGGVSIGVICTFSSVVFICFYPVIYLMVFGSIVVCALLIDCLLELERKK